MDNADELLRKVKSGEEAFELIEVMACPGGCVMGGGQPADVYESIRNRNLRSEGLYKADRNCFIKATQENAKMEEFFETFLAGQTHHLLHRNLDPEYAE